MRFSIEAGDRRAALELQSELDGFSPWLIEIDRGSFLVQGTIGPAKLADLRSLVERWASDRQRDPRLEILDHAPDGPVH